MSKISGRETKPEILVRKYLFANGFRYRKNVHNLPGTPDIVLSQYKTIIFVNGCFWHGHNCSFGKLPDTRLDFWKNKIEKNKARDQKNFTQLKSLGWKVIIVWQCQIRNQKLRETNLRKLIENIKS